MSEVSRVYVQGAREVRALTEANLRVAPGERLVVMGPSGSGKSTLLHLAGGLDHPSSGHVFFEGRDLATLDEGGRARLRREAMGFVFQFFNLLPTLTAAENVRLPLDLAGFPRREGRQRAEELLEVVGLIHRREHHPEHLSGGEMQRVAVARALAADPRLILADEPTGNLDSGTGAAILELLGSHATGKRALIIATHDPAALNIATRVFRLQDGRLGASGVGP